MIADNGSRAGGRAASGLALVNGAIALFGLAGVLGKLSALPAPYITLGRVVIATPAVGAVAWLQRAPLRARSRRDAVILTGQGALLAFHWVAFFQAINVSSVAIGLLAFSSFPLFTALLEPLLLRQPLRRLELVGALLVLPGIYLLAPGFSLASGATQGVLWGTLAGATFALLSVTNRWLGRAYASVTISLYQEGVAAVVLLPTLWLLPLAGGVSLWQVGLLVALGLVCTALAHTLFIAGLRTVHAQLASLLASLEPVWGILFALILLGEVPSWRTLIGGAIILLATGAPTVLSLQGVGKQTGSV